MLIQEMCFQLTKSLKEQLFVMLNKKLVTEVLLPELVVVVLLLLDIVKMV